MTTIAAVGVYLTYDKERRERRKQGFEDHFFRLVSDLELIKNNLKIDRFKKSSTVSVNEKKFVYQPLKKMMGIDVLESKTGIDALKTIVYGLRNRLAISDYNNSKLVHNAYSRVYTRQVDRLGHYFRAVYYIYKLIDEDCPEDKRKYARLVRSHLSESELRLLAYNISVGEGRFKFRSLARKYAIFHNMLQDGRDSHEKAELEFFIRAIGTQAFRFESQPKFTYDSLSGEDF